MYDRARAAVLEPTCATHAQSTALTIDYLQVQAAAALVKMHDTRTVLPQYLSSQGGELCAANTVQGHADTLGCEASNDKFAESVFGTFDRMLKRSEGLSREAASGLAHAMHHKSFVQGDAVARRKPQEPPPPGIGFFMTLPVQEQRGLVEYCRLTQRSERVIDRQDNAEVAAYVKAKVKTNSEIELHNLITEWGYGLSFFDRWQQRGVSTSAAMNAGIGGCDSAQAKLDWLREQIEMRTRGLQWVEFKAKWSSSNDENIGTVDELAAHLRTIIEHERARRAAGELPSSAPAPILRRKSFKDLGTPTAQALALAEQRLEYSTEELRAKAVAERARLEAAGEIDAVSDVQPAVPPDFGDLEGKELDLRWRYYTVENGKRVQQYIWCTGVVVEVADGRTTKRSARCKSTLPWGAVRIRWPEDVEYGECETFVWSVLKPVDWNKECHLGWRYSVKELQKRRQA